jgi:hypothetical protein
VCRPSLRARRQKDARRGANTNRFSGAADFAAYVIDAFDWLHREGAHVPKMMSIGLHLQMIGRPGRIGALDRILRHIANRGDAWIARRADIANHWLAQFPETRSSSPAAALRLPQRASRPHWPFHLGQAYRVRSRPAAGASRIRTCMGLFLSSGCFGFC